jgi:hypothetical protein
MNRYVKSSKGTSLGGANNGGGLISAMIDNPGSYTVKENVSNEVSEMTALNKDCKKCEGVGVVTSYYPNNTYLTDNPDSITQSPLLCCNQQRKALQRVLPTNTNIQKNYYQTTYMYLYNRCQTFQQRQFNFITGPIDKKIQELFMAYPFVTAKILEYSKPGDPLSIINLYVAQCNPNFTIEKSVEIGFVSFLSKSLLDVGFISQEQYNMLMNDLGISVNDFVKSLQNVLTKEEYQQVIDYLYQLAANPDNGPLISGPSNPKGCSQVYYKPNNPQFAKQGGVSSSTRTLKLTVDTINTSAYNQRKIKSSNSPVDTNATYIYKDKVPQCQAQTYTGNPFFFSGQHQNKLICQNKTNGSEYHTYNSINNSSAGNYIGATQSI